jgi:hypothetical protein
MIRRESEIRARGAKKKAICHGLLIVNHATDKKPELPGG